jgi:threonine synthase
MMSTTSPSTVESAATGLQCVRCESSFALSPMFDGCPACAQPDERANLSITYDYDRARRSFTPDQISRRGRLGVWRWAELLAIGRPDARVTLLEGDTPLVPLRGLGVGEVLVKDESRNPTWSYKDRLCAVAVSKAVELGARVCAVSSSGNHGAAAAAYAARAGLRCVAFTRPDVPETMKVLMQVYGAEVFATTRLGRWALVQAGVEQAGWFPLSNYTAPPTGNPYGVEGYKSIAFEVWEQLGWRAPGTLVVPTGYGEGLFGAWRGFQDLHRLGLVDRMPRLIAAETATGAPLARALQLGSPVPVTVEASPSVAFSINTSNGSFQALRAVRDSGGISIPVSETEILEAQTKLARQGLFAEASSATSLAAVIRGRAEQHDLPEPIVVVMTSGGLKDIGPPSGRLPRVEEVAPEWEALLPLLKPEFLPAETSRAGEARGA